MADGLNIDGEIQKRLDTVQSLELVQSRVEQLVEKPITPATVRSKLTLIVVCSFLIFLAGIGVFVVTGGEMGRATALTDMLTRLVLPLVTLMIGHYFGTKAD